jgi:ZIP family zinc transporter
MRPVRLVLVVIALGASVGLALLVIERPWESGRGGSEEAVVTDSELHPGEIVLTVRNDSPETVRLAQALVNDAFYDFRAQRTTLVPRSATEVTIRYPWLTDEGYEIGLVTSTGEIIEYEIEHAVPA